ncbi:MAG: cobalamin-binding protein, partial [Pseudomonadota bacterium]
CGGHNIFGDLDTPAATVTEEAVVAADPDVILTTGTRDDLVRWTRFGGRAVRTGQLHPVNADHATRASIRLLDGAREICARLDEARRAPQTR